MSMRVIPNPGQSSEELRSSMYGNIGVNRQPYPQQVGPAHLPGSPPFQMPPQNMAGPGPSYAAGPPRPVQAPGNLPGPIHPGPGWHVGPAVAYNPAGYGGIVPANQMGEFKKMFKFGVVDNGILVLATLAGVGLDDKIAKVLKTPKGWGPLIGASVGNAVSDGVAAMTDDGAKMGAVLGVVAGAMAPVLPIFIAASVLKKSPTHKMTQYSLMGLAGLMTFMAFNRRPAIAPVA